MKNYLVTIKIGKVITNKLVKAETAEEAEKEALRCASQETTDLARGYTISAEKKHSADKAVINGCSSERRRYTHVWKENLNNDY